MAFDPAERDFYSALRDRQMRMTGESLIHDRQRMATILDEHRGVAEALRDGDLERTLQAVQAHLAGTPRSLGLAAEPRATAVGPIRGWRRQAGLL
jgi:DNA-binding GntR family transcriptional regulator